MITVERPAVEAFEAPPQPETKPVAVPEIVARELPSVFFRRPRLMVAIYLIRAIEPEEWRLARQGLRARLRPNRAA